MTPEDLIQEASILKSWGFPVFPLTRKRPRCRWRWFQKRRPDDREIGRLFSQRDVDGVAAVPGALNTFAVRDYDTRSAYRQWAQRHPELAERVPTVESYRGYHVWSRSTVALYRKSGDGEFIGDGRHYVVMPPTLHPKGSSYRWLSGPPLGPSEFPLLDPFEAGFVPCEGGPRSGRVDIRHSSSSCCLPLPLPTELPRVVWECVLRTLPHRVGQRNGQLHQFARALRDHVPDDAPPGLLHDAVRLWWQMALSVIGTKDFGTTLADFRRAWAGVRVPMSQSRPLAALRRGVSGSGDSTARLLGACRELARETGGEFFLSARTAAAAIGLGKSRAAKLLKKLVADGELKIARRGFVSGSKRRATYYRLGGTKAAVRSDP